MNSRTLSSKRRWNSVSVPSGSSAQYVSATESIGDSMTYLNKENSVYYPEEGIQEPCFTL